MRIYDIALGIMIFNLSLAMIGAAGIFPDVSAPAGMDASDYTTDDIDAADAALQPTPGAIADFIPGYSSMYQAYNLLKDFLYSTLFFPLMLGNEPFNLPGFITMPLGALMIIIYMSGIAQFIRGTPVGA